MARLVDQEEFGLLVVAINVLVMLATFSIAGTDFAMIYHVAVSERPERERGAILTGLKIVVTFNLLLAPPSPRWRRRPRWAPRSRVPSY